MFIFKIRHVRALAASALLVMGAALAACAGNPAPPPPVSAGSGQGSALASDRSVSLTVVDQEGAPLRGAEVRIRSVTGSSYRASGRADGVGLVHFKRVPSQVRIEAFYQARVDRFGKTYNARGNRDEQFEVPNSGTNPLRMTIEVEYEEVQSLPGMRQ